MRATGLAVALGACLVLSSCFDAPVQESLRLRFLSNGAVVVTSKVEIAASARISTNALERRLAEVRRSLAEGTDPWSQRFASLTPAAERATWEKKLGDLSSVSHAAVVTEPEDLSRFFSDTSVQVTYAVRPESGVAELTLTPGVSNRASYRQRRDMDAVLGSWSEDLAVYFAAARRVYAYLAEHPEREHAVLGTLFRDLLPEGTVLEELAPEEKRPVERLDAAISQVLTVLQADGEQAYSIDEISHLVYDPFPARLAIALPASAQELEGFERTPSGELTVPPCGFWDALRSLEGRWLSPDLVSAYVEGLRQEGGFRLDGLLAQKRRAEAVPNAAEIREALLRALTPRRTYRASWAIVPESDPPADLWASPQGR